MPSVVTISGAEFGRSRKQKCKPVRNRKSGCVRQLCQTGLGATGWTFVKGTTRCPRKRG